MGLAEQFSVAGANPLKRLELSPVGESSNRLLYANRARTHERLFAPTFALRAIEGKPDLKIIARLKPSIFRHGDLLF
jgi:hypothetical protein